MNFIIDYLYNHQKCIKDISKTLFFEWSHLVPGMTEEDITASIPRRTNIGKIPFALVALDDNGNWIGTVSIKEKDLESRTDLTPWLAAFYVKPNYRNNGIGKELLEMALKEAMAMDIKVLYLYTEKASEYYRKKGWEILEEKTENGTPVSVMKYCLC
jgi:N-acetylglutamate synthase-like GNAT family acetyltransferase